MKELKQYIKFWLVDLGIIPYDRQPELEQEYLEALKKWKALKTVVYLPTFDVKKRQPALNKATTEMWKARNKLLAAGYKEKDIVELRRGI